jgi:hypothetical protein
MLNLKPDCRQASYKSPVNQQLARLNYAICFTFSYALTQAFLFYLRKQ